MRFVVTNGTSRKAAVPGYFVAGKTGTRDMLINGRYHKDKVATTFVGIIGEDQKKPKYMLVVLLEDPKGKKNTYGFTAAGWNAAPIGGRILERVAMMTGLRPTSQPDHLTDPYLKTISFKKR
jgi:cell division protein FtsI (penicillin-binding protein 3)